MNSEKLKDQNIQKFCSFTLTMNNSKTKLKKKNCIYNSIYSKRVEYLGINLTKEMKNMCT